jgi:hypothetical protein
MKHYRLNKSSLAERFELNRELEDAVEADLIRPSHRKFVSPFMFCAES